LARAADKESQTKQFGKKTEKRGVPHEIRREYDLSGLKNGARGKYLTRLRAATNLYFFRPLSRGISPTNHQSMRR
jgi:hypothetical protein